MKIISFAETTPALLAGRKTCTRREWNPGYAQSFHAGERVQAYNRSPRIGGRPVAILQLTQAPQLALWRHSASLPESDWEAEGFGYMEENGLLLFDGLTPREVWESWKKPRGVRGPLYIVRFRVERFLP